MRKKLNTSNDENPQETEHKLKWLSEVKKGQYYTTQQKIYLNNLRGRNIFWIKNNRPLILIVKKNFGKYNINKGWLTNNTTIYNKRDN